jgi:hypothetical protein
MAKKDTVTLLVKGGNDEELTLEQLRLLLQQEIFTSSVTISTAEKRQMRQYEMNDYFISHTIDLSGWNELLKAVPQEDQQATRREMFQALRRRLETTASQQKELIHMEQYLDGIKTSTMDDEKRKGNIKAKDAK